MRRTLLHASVGHRAQHLLGALALAAVLAGCGDRDPASDTRPGADDSAETLPAPQRSDGGVTGMPDTPGPGRIGPPEPPAVLPADALVDSEGNPIAQADIGVGTDPDVVAAGSEPLSAEPAGAAAGEPGAAEAVAVLREYYAAINQGSFARAYRLWANGGRASGQTPQQFADGFANTGAVAAEVMPPGRIDAGAGSRHIEVPVAIAGVQRDGNTRNYVGAYTLRRSVVDGASAEQRAWRIVSADLREVQPQPAP